MPHHYELPLCRYNQNMQIPHLHIWALADCNLCVGCSADKHTVNAAANATACGQACSASSSCKISLFDSERNVPPMGVKCFLYDEAPTSVANTGLSRFTCWQRHAGGCKAVSSATVCVRAQAERTACMQYLLCMQCGTSCFLQAYPWLWVSRVDILAQAL